ncbi:MAG TPA: Scr1 family TA system antitoxin-like transcriptional regulator [Streptosporangiaceae bacterium]|nr:Scr1 family TA system antitoxin-like transcriptional regulator [Streptosporangiaceae bacterium]
MTGALPEQAAQGTGNNAPPGPAARRRRLGANLRRLREARSLRLQDVAARLDLAANTLSRIETGKAPTRTSYLIAMLDLYGVVNPGQRKLLTDLARDGQGTSWWAAYDDLLPAGAGHYLDLEAAAAQVRAFAAQAVPGLLQTADYAAAAIPATVPSLTASGVRQLVALQLRRQEMTRNSKQRLLAILDESALLRSIGTARTIVGQLRHLLAATADPAEPDIACCVGPGGQVITRCGDVRAVQSTFTLLARAAMSPADSTHLIQNTATRWERQATYEH